MDGWFKQRTSDEKVLKQKVRYDEIMSQDLGIYYNQDGSFDRWKKGKTLINNTVRVMPAPPAYSYADTDELYVSK